MIKNHIIFNPASERRFECVRAQDSFIWNEKGEKLIDFTSGWNVTNIGWNHPEVNEAVIKQAQKNVYAPMWTFDPAQEEYAALFTSLLPKSLNAITRVTGGTEANEQALKIARATTGRKKIIGFKDTYHGESFGTMALGYRPEYVKDIAPLVPDFIQLDFPSVYKSGKSEKETLAEFAELLDSVLRKKDVAALVTEAGIITGWGSTYVAPKGYLKLIHELTRRYGTLLILDEVGTGFSRLGKLFGMEIEGVVPDLATFAKGLSNGAVPIGAVAASSDLITPVLRKTNLTSTFGATPLACAAATTVLKIHNRDKVWLQARDSGQWMMSQLTKKLSSHQCVGDIRGIGMEIGVVFVKDKKTKEADGEVAIKIVERAYSKGLHLVYGDEGSIQLMPPLTTPKTVLKEGLDIFLEAVKSATG